LSGAGHDLIVGIAFGPEEPDDCRHRRQADAAFAKPLAAEPVLVKIQALRQDIEDGLMKTCRQQPPYSRLCHDSLMPADTMAAAILAGGAARRFGGQDKSRLIVEGRTIIVRQVDVLQRVASDVFVVGGPPDRYADLGLAVYADREAGLGAIGGLVTALEIARQPRVLVIASDLPFLEAAVLRQLAALSDHADGAWIRTARGVEPLLACYRRECLGPIRQAVDAGQRKLADLGAVLRMAELSEADLTAMGASPRLLTNVNTPDDWRRLQ
jgi:molybdopterin-guanine dinucleotide biosynthesis protein A